MNESEVFNLIAVQLNGSTRSASGWEFKQFVIQQPERVIFQSTNGLAWPLWVVLRETKNGYIIGYDDEDKSFQLVSDGVVVSEYQTLMEAINSL